MPFHDSARKHILGRDAYTCQDSDCENPPRQFFLTGVLFRQTGEIVKNGGWQITASHLEARDYRTRYDYHPYNEDGSYRGMAMCVLCHIVHEVGITCKDNAYRLALNQTIRTYDYIMNTPDKVDMDVPHGIFGRVETIDLNNERRMRLQRVLIKRFGLFVGGVPDISVERAKVLLGSGGRRRV